MARRRRSGDISLSAHRSRDQAAETWRHSCTRQTGKRRQSDSLVFRIDLPVSNHRRLLAAIVRGPVGDNRASHVSSAEHPRNDVEGHMVYMGSFRDSPSAWTQAPRYTGPIEAYTFCARTPERKLEMLSQHSMECCPTLAIRATTSQGWGTYGGGERTKGSSHG